VVSSTPLILVADDRTISQLEAENFSTLNASAGIRAAGTPSGTRAG
jgi:hypothetical protein